MIGVVTGLDPRLPELDAALDPETVTPWLRAALERAGEDDAADYDLLDREVLKHKPGRRCAVAYTLHGPGGRRRLFAKVFGSDRGAAVLVNMERFHAAIDPARLLVPRPLLYVAESRLMITEFLEGESFDATLYAQRPRQAARRMGLGAAALHRCGVPCARRWYPSKEVGATGEWIRGLTGRSPGGSARATELLERLRRQAAGLPRKIRFPIHRDLYAEQFHDCSGRTALLDLDDVRSGDPAVDVGNFIAHLTLRGLQFPESAPACDAARRPFLETWTEAAPVDLSLDDLPSRIRFYEATTLLRLSGVYAARERWAGTLPDRLLDACERLLAGRRKDA